MKLAIFAATGGVGRHLLEQSLSAGHDVTAVVRTPMSISGRVKMVQADLASPDPAALRVAVRGADAVLSALGRRRASDAGITSRGTRAIIHAMKNERVRRLIVISAAPVSTTASPGRPHPPRHDPGEGIVVRHVLTPIIKLFLGELYADLALMEDLLRESGLEWTAIRPPRLTNGRLRGTYRSALERNLPGGTSISRADVARAMLDVLRHRDTVGHALGVAY